MTTQEINKQGDQLADLLPSINLILELINLITLSDKGLIDEVLLKCHTTKALSAIYDQLERVYKKVDEIAFDLMECTEDKRHEISA